MERMEMLVVAVESVYRLSFRQELIRQGVHGKFCSFCKVNFPFHGDTVRSSEGKECARISICTFSHSYESQCRLLQR